MFRRAGHPEMKRDLPIARLVAVAPTDAEAEVVARRGAEFSSRYLPKEAIAAFRVDGQIVDPIDHYMDDVIIHGSPERVVDTLKRLEEETPLDYLLLSPVSEKTFELFTDHVLPQVLSS